MFLASPTLGHITLSLDLEGPTHFRAPKVPWTLCLKTVSSLLLLLAQGVSVSDCVPVAFGALSDTDGARSSPVFPFSTTPTTLPQVIVNSEKRQTYINYYP